MGKKFLDFYPFRATCILSVAILSIGLSSRGGAIEGGGALSDERWGFVLNIRTENLSCSAARVSKKYAITAAHCIGDSPLQVYSGRDAQEYVGTATSVFVDPRYTDREYDVAVIEIDTTSRDAVVTIPLAPASVYRNLLAGKYPNRTTLAAGFGQDKDRKIGRRKWAFERGLSIFPLPEHAGEIHSATSLGATRPGDSGGPILVRTNSDEGMALFAVVSGENLWTREYDDGESDTDAIVRNAPVASTLCKAPQKLAKSIGFDKRACPRIEKFEEVLYGREVTTAFDVSVALWKSVHASKSPLPNLFESYRNALDQFAVAAFEQDDNVFLRRYLAARLDSYDWRYGDSAENTDVLEARIFNALATHREAANEKYSRLRHRKRLTSLMSDSERRLQLIRTRPMQEECGHIPCIESFFIGVTADGIGRENDWDFLTRNSGEQVLDGGLSVGTVIDLACETIRVGQAGGRNLEGLVSRVQALGFKREFISSRPGSFDDEFSVAAKTENLEIDLSGMHLFIDVRVTGNSIREPAFLRTGDWLFERLSSNAGFREVYEGAWLSNDDNQDLLVEPGYFKLMLFVEEEGDRLEDFELVKILGCIP